MGVVYEGHDEKLDRDIAIKLLKPGADSVVVERFLREAKVASSLNHPNIVTVFDAGQSERGHFIVMELVRGRTLRELIGTKALPLPQVLSLVRQVAEAIAVAHEAGLVHRDIKPENVMVRDDGYVKVVDFGLTRHLPLLTSEVTTGDAEFLTKPYTLIGTVKYMSPEQANGEGAGPASDVFSLGILFYELATGRHPHDAPSQFGTLHSIISHPIVPPSRLNPELAPFDALLTRMLDKNPGSRPSAADVAARLASPGARPQVSSLSHPAVSSLAVGRAYPRAELQRAFDECKRGHGLVFCVAGEAGIGKTTLVQQFLTDVARESDLVHVAAGRCSERLAGAEAYLVLLDALESLLPRDDGSVVQTMKTVAPRWYRQVFPAADEPGSSASHESASMMRGTQERLKRELLAFLTEACRQRPVILYFDDVHWADEATIDMLGYLTAHFERLPLLVLVTYRSEELFVQKHPFLILKRELQPRGLCREVTLKFFTREEIVEYVDRRLPNHHIPTTFIDLLEAKTEGSPLFVADVVSYLIDQQVLGQDASGWTLTRPVPDIAREIPESIRGLIHRKIDGLDEFGRRILSAASVQGQEFDAVVIAKAIGTDPADLEERLNDLDRVHGFARPIREHECPDGTLTLRYCFVHVLYQNILYQSLTPARKISFSRAIAQALEQLYGERTGEIAAALAMLHETARDFSRAVEFFHQAATRARDLMAYREAFVLGRRALDNLLMLPENGERRQRELRILLTLGLPAMTSRGFSSADARDIYDRARTLCLEFNETEQFGHVLYGLIAFHIVRLQLDNAAEASTQIVQLADVTGDPNLRVQGTNAMGMVAFYGGDFDTAVEHFERLRRHFDADGRRNVLRGYGYDPLTAAHCYLSWSQWCLGFPDRALREAEDALKAARELDYPYALALALNFACALAMWRGEWSRATAWNAQLRQISSHEGFSYFIGAAAFFEGLVQARKTGTEASLKLMCDGMEALKTMDARASPRRLMGEFATYLARAGRVDEGLRVLSVELRETTTDRFWQAELLRVQGELLLIRGGQESWTAAERSFRDAVDISRKQRAKSLELRATTSLCRTLHRRGRSDEALQLLREVDAWFTEGFETADLQDARSVLATLRTKR